MDFGIKVGPSVAANSWTPLLRILCSVTKKMRTVMCETLLQVFKINTNDQTAMMATSKTSRTSTTSLRRISRNSHKVYRIKGIQAVLVGQLLRAQFKTALLDLLKVN